MQFKDLIAQQIKGQGMLPLFYHDSIEVSFNVISTLIKSGIGVIEYTNRGKASLANFNNLKQLLKEEFPNVLLGAGTVRNIFEAQAFIEAGADFLVSPVANFELGNFIFEKGIFWIPGAMTPSEINVARGCHASIIKIFPANTLKPQFLKAMKEIYPDQLFIPTGGIGIDYEDLFPWFESGACAVGIGGRLITKEVLQEGNYQELFEQTKKALNLIDQVKICCSPKKL